MKYQTFLIAMGVLIGVGNAHAAIVNPCDVSDIQITHIQLLDGVDPGMTVPPINSSKCIGPFKGNNSVFINPTVGNLGYDEDGWFNKESIYWPSLPAAFTDNSELLDLDGDGDVDDPGWIYLGKDEGMGFKGATSTDGINSYTFIDDLLVLSNCKNKDDANTACVGGDAVMGEWAWHPPAMNPQELLDLLGGLFFDQAAVIFKSANYFVVYNFAIGELGLDPVLANDFNYSVNGIWDTSETLINNGGQPAGLSNISLWARDPILPAVMIPEPPSIGLFALFFTYLISRCKETV